MQQHERCQHDAEDVQNERDRIVHAARRKAHPVQVRQVGDAVRQEPQREQQGHGPLPGRGIDQQHEAAHHAQNTTDKRRHRAEARMALHARIKHNVHDSRGHGKYAIDHHKALERRLWPDKGRNAEQHEQDADDERQPAKAGTVTHDALPPSAPREGSA